MAANAFVTLPLQPSPDTPAPWLGQFFSIDHGSVVGVPPLNPVSVKAPMPAFTASQTADDTSRAKAFKLNLAASVEVSVCAGQYGLSAYVDFRTETTSGSSNVTVAHTMTMDLIRHRLNLQRTLCNGKKTVLELLERAKAAGATHVVSHVITGHAVNVNVRLDADESRLLFALKAGGSGTAAYSGISGTLSADLAWSTGHSRNKAAIGATGTATISSAYYAPSSVFGAALVAQSTDYLHGAAAKIVDEVREASNPVKGAASTIGATGLATSFSLVAIDDVVAIAKVLVSDGAAPVVASKAVSPYLALARTYEAKTVRLIATLADVGTALGALATSLVPLGLRSLETEARAHQWRLRTIRDQLTVSVSDAIARDPLERYQSLAYVYRVFAQRVAAVHREVVTATTSFFARVEAQKAQLAALSGAAGVAVTPETLPAPERSERGLSSVANTVACGAVGADTLVVIDRAAASVVGSTDQPYATHDISPRVRAASRAAVAAAVGLRTRRGGGVASLEGGTLAPSPGCARVVVRDLTAEPLYLDASHLKARTDGAAPELGPEARARLETLPANELRSDGRAMKVEAMNALDAATPRFLRCLTVVSTSLRAAPPPGALAVMLGTSGNVNARSHGIEIVSAAVTFDDFDAAALDKDDDADEAKRAYDELPRDRIYDGTALAHYAQQHWVRRTGTFRSGPWVIVVPSGAALTAIVLNKPAENAAAVAPKGVTLKSITLFALAGRALRSFEFDATNKAAMEVAFDKGEAVPDPAIGLATTATYLVPTWTRYAANAARRVTVMDTQGTPMPSTSTSRVEPNDAGFTGDVPKAKSAPVPHRALTALRPQLRAAASADWRVAAAVCADTTSKQDDPEERVVDVCLARDALPPSGWRAAAIAPSLFVCWRCAPVDTAARAPHVESGLYTICVGDGDIVGLRAGSLSVVPAPTPRGAQPVWCVERCGFDTCTIRSPGRGLLWTRRDEQRALTAEPPTSAAAQTLRFESVEGSTTRFTLRFVDAHAGGHAPRSGSEPDVLGLDIESSSVSGTDMLCAAAASQRDATVFTLLPA